MFILLKTYYICLFIFNIML